MTRTLIYGIIALIIVIVLAGIAFFFTDPNRNGFDQENIGNGGFFGQLFPFGPGGDEGGTPLFEGTGSEDGVAPLVPRLRQVSVNPVAGGYLFERDDVTMIRFIDRASGNVYETEAENTTVKRITNTTVPGIQEVLWANENEFIIRYLNGEAIETFFVALDSDVAGEQSLDGNFIQSFDRGSIDKNGETLFAVFENENGSDLVISNSNGKDARVVLSSPIRSWVPLQSNNSLFVQTAPASGINGSLYQIINSTLIKIIDDIPGLVTTVSPGGQYVLANSGEVSNIILAIIDTEDGSLLTSPIDTVVEKCAFDSESPLAIYCGAPDILPQAIYPDDWYLGNVSFEDSIWLIKPEEGVAEFIAAGSDVNEVFDVWQPMVSPDGGYFLFINKNDLSLWSIRLSEEN